MQHHAAHPATDCVRRVRVFVNVLVIAWMTAGATAAKAAETGPLSSQSPTALAATQVQAGATAPSAANQSASSDERIEVLIRQLGDPRYSSRRAAAAELQQIGAEAFDMLHAATADTDPEVAASAHYLIRRIAVRWIDRDDSAAVRNLLRDYDRLPDNIRLRRVDDLSELAGGEGIAALCRIARFDRSPIVSRMAALAIIRPEKGDPASESQVDIDEIAAQLGDSSRVASDWLRRYLAQLRDPAAAAGDWQKLIDEELGRLKQNAADTSPKIVTGLLWNLADLQRQIGNRGAITAVIDQMMSVDPDSADAMSIDLLKWMKEHKSWEVLDDFLAKHEAALGQSKRPLYYAAMARAAQGKIEDADQLAERAAQIDSQSTLESFLTAKDLEENSQFKWAVREYRRSIDDQKVASHEGILARIYLASLLHDYEQEKEAAEVLEPLARAIRNDGQTGQLYSELQRYYEGRLGLPKANAVSARLHFYRSGQHHAAKEWSRERAELEQAIKFDPTDADVLIAMYRLPETDDAWRTMVKKRITDLAQQFQQEIDQNPSDPNAYNQWAWLVSNTEGDYEKAVRYSHRSIELIPPSAGASAGGSFMDTLGRCYFAAGDLENALKYQREAIKRVDYMQVMHRQLAQFEKAYAEKQAAGDDKPASDSN